MSETDCGIKVGDLCHHGVNRYPRYRVIHIYDGRAWLRDADTGADAVVGLEQCQRMEEGPATDEPHHDKAPGPFSNPPAAPSIPTWPDGTPRP